MIGVVADWSQRSEIAGSWSIGCPKAESVLKQHACWLRGKDMGELICKKNIDRHIDGFIQKEPGYSSQHQVYGIIANRIYLDLPITRLFSGGARLGESQTVRRVVFLICDHCGWLTWKRLPFEILARDTEFFVGSSVRIWLYWQSYSCTVVDVWLVLLLDSSYTQVKGIDLNLIDITMRRGKHVDEGLFLSTPHESCWVMVKSPKFNS